MATTSAQGQLYFCVCDAGVRVRECACANARVRGYVVGVVVAVEVLVAAAPGRQPLGKRAKAKKGRRDNRRD